VTGVHTCALPISLKWSQDEPDAFFLYEQYVDQAAFDAHRETDHFKVIVQERIAPMLEERRAEVYILLAT
jgi:quinol monooxygenase YgiN